MNPTTMRQSVHLLSWRSRWLRSVLALVLVVLAVRLVWGWYTDRTLRGQLEVIRGRGEPVAVEDMTFASVPDAENAWNLQARAARAHIAGVDSPRNSNDEFRNYPPYPNFWMRRAEASEQAHRQVFALARQARQLSRVQFRDRMTSPVINMRWSYLNQMRQLANTLADGANYANVRGDDAEAIERILDVLHLSRSLRQDDFMLSQLVAIGIDALAMDAAQVIAPGLRVRPGATTRPATLGQVRQLIGQLLDEELAWERFAASLRTERLVMLDLFRVRADGTWFIHPLAEMEAVRANRNFDIAIEASKLRDKPRVTALLALARWEQPVVEPVFFIGNMSGRKEAVPRYSRWFLIWSGDMSRYFETQIRDLAERRATAISLAAQLYRADFGRWPARLEELVPTYLSSLPADPYHDDGRPFGYVMKRLPGGSGDRPLIYFDAGEDDPSLVQDEPMYGFRSASVPSKVGHVFRQYRDLTRFKPVTPPSTQAVDDDPKKTDAPGNQPKQDDPAK
jgi:hypothetical protein